MGNRHPLILTTEYLHLQNTFQAVIISDGSKTYSIFTYKCDLLIWSNEATIGFNAASDYYVNHPLSGTVQANTLGCVNEVVDGSVWNNVIYDLVPGTVVSGPTPLSPTSFGRFGCKCSALLLTNIEDFYCVNYFIIIHNYF